MFKKILLYLIFSLPVFASDRITIDAGGKKFHTTRATLNIYPRCMLAKMLNSDSKYFNTDLNEYSLDDDPKTVEIILNLLRYKKWHFESLQQAENVRVVADKLCHPLVKRLDKWIKEYKEDAAKSNFVLEEIYKNTKKTLKPVLGLNQEKKEVWFLCYASNHKPIGCKTHGSAQVDHIKSLAEEYNKRNFFPHLVYAWSGRGYGIYNIENDMLIGEICSQWKNISHLNNTSQFLNLSLITKARYSNGDIYLCAPNDKGRFSIFNSMTNEKMLDGHSFQNVDKCLEALQENFS